MKTKTFIAFIFLSTAICSYCPIWKCDKETTVAFQGYCFYGDEELNTIHAGPFCKQKGKECSLFNFIQQDTLSMVCPKDWNQEATQAPAQVQNEQSSLETQKTAKQTTSSSEENNPPEQSKPAAKEAIPPPAEQETKPSQETTTQTTTEETSKSTEETEQPAQQTTASTEETNPESENQQQEEVEEANDSKKEKQNGQRLLQTTATVWDKDSHISEILRNRYCLKPDGSPKNWSIELNCNLYCVPFQKRQLVDETAEWLSDMFKGPEQDCDYWKFAQAQVSSDTNFQAAGKDGWAACEANNECKSDKCDCVPNIDGKGSCAQSYDDDMYKIYFEFACTRFSHHDYWDNTCAYYILIQLSHYIESLSVNAQKLSCLAYYGDLVDLYNVIVEVEEDEWWPYALALLVSSLLVCICCCCCCCLCKCKKRKKPQPYGELEESA